jgi:phage baseplate assembly protein W
VVDIPHFKFPFTFKAGHADVVEQDGDDDVVQSVAVLLSTPVGSRVELPEYGIDDPTFRVGVDLPSILTAIEDWEPRAQVDLTSDIDSLDDLMRVIEANVANGGVE